MERDEEVKPSDDSWALMGAAIGMIGGGACLVWLGDEIRGLDVFFNSLSPRTFFLVFLVPLTVIGAVTGHWLQKLNDSGKQ